MTVEGLEGLAFYCVNFQRSKIKYNEEKVNKHKNCTKCNFGLKINKMRKGSDRSITIGVSPSSLGIAVGSVALFLSVAHVLVHIPKVFIGDSFTMMGFFRFFNLGEETSLPTYLSSLFLLFSGLTSFLIAYKKDGINENHWWVLSIGLLVMSFDEATQIHEGIIGNITTYGSGIFFYSWLIFYVPIVIALSVYFIPFLLRLENKYCLMFFASAVVFLGGAVGFEMVGGYLREYNMGGGDLRGVRVLLEESGEIFGVAILLYTLSLYAEEEKISVIFRFN